MPCRVCVCDVMPHCDCGIYICMDISKTKGPTQLCTVNDVAMKYVCYPSKLFTSAMKCGCLLAKCLKRRTNKNLRHMKNPR